MQPTNQLFVLRAVTKTFGDLQALAGIDLEIEAGEQVALLGPSGAGKSTLLALLTAAQVPTTGELTIFGQDVTRLSGAGLRRVQRRIGTIYQQFHLVGNLPVIHNVNAGRLGEWSLAKALWSLLVPQATQETYKILLQVGIGEKLYTRTDQLSGGQQQRVALARVLAQNPAVILADEPVSNVDPEWSRELLDLLRDLCHTTGKTMIASLHDVELARSHFQRVIGLRAGRIDFDVPPARLTQAMIDKLYVIAPHVEEGARW